MRPLAIDEIVPLERYAAERAEYRERVIAHKKRRRVPVGDEATLLFEDRETLRFQVQEMLWVERIAEPEKVQLELDVYNELMPGSGELSATLFLEITEPDRIRPQLDRLVGIDEHVALVVGGAVVRARFDERQLEEDRISAVHYLKFVLPEETAQRFAERDLPAALRIDHPRYERETPLPPDVRKSLAADLAGDPAPLLAGGPGPAPAPRDDLLFESGRVRARRAGNSVIVEPVAEVASLLDATPDLLAELLEAVQRVAAQVVEKAGSCRVETRIGGGTERLRFHLRP